MNLDETLKQLDTSIKEARITVELGDALERLLKNRDFKKVILEGYLQQEAIRLVSVKQDPAVQGKDSQESIIRQIDAIGCFQGYLRLIERQTEMAKKTIETTEELREELLAEDGQE